MSSCHTNLVPRHRICIITHLPKVITQLVQHMAIFQTYPAGHPEDGLINE